MSEQTLINFLIGVMVALAGFFIVNKIWHAFHDDEMLTYEEHRARDMASRAATVTQMFCRDCGAALVSVRLQDGFDPEIGQPKYYYQRGCPSGNAATRAWPWCGHPVANVTVRGHSHSDSTTDPRCPVCIDQMLIDHVIDLQTAKKLMLQTGATVPPEPRDYGSLLFPSHPTLASVSGGSGSPFTPPTIAVPVTPGTPVRPFRKITTKPPTS